MFSFKPTRRSVVAGGGAIVLGTAANAFLGSPAVRAAQLKPVTLANAQGTLNQAMQELLNQKKYLQEFGLEPNLIGVSDGSKILAALIGGSADATMMTGFGQVFPAIEKGAKMKILAGGALPPSLSLFTGKPDIHTLKDLEGKSVATGSVGALLYDLTITLLKQKGVDVKKVNFINAGSSVSTFRATIAGTVDAGLGETAAIEDAGKYKVRLIPGGNMTTDLPKYTFQGAWATDAAIKAKRDVIVRSLAAYCKLYRFVQTPEAKDDFLKAWGTLFSGKAHEGVLQWNYIQKYKPFDVDLVLSEERLNYMQQLNIGFGTQKAVLPFSQVADMSLAKDAIKMLS